MSSLTKSYILFDDLAHEDLLPITFTRPVAEIRVGILTIREKWDHHLDTSCSYYTQPYLREKFPACQLQENVLINGSILPEETLIGEILQLKPGEGLVKENVLLACNTGREFPEEFRFEEFSRYKTRNSAFPVHRIAHLWDIFLYNGTELAKDFAMLTSGKTSAPLSKTNTTISAGHVFAEEGAVIEGAVINASAGPVYIGKGAEIMEGSLVRGPFALCDHAALKMGAKVYGPTTIGPYSKVGGEINNSVLQGYSNKAHDGFLGNSVIGEWCNIGADSNNSNLKNNYTNIKLWSYRKESFEDTGIQFCGLIMGDHSKCGINTMFNTGTVVGVSANIFGPGFPRNFIPSFSWGGAGGFSVYQLQKAFETAEIVMKRRGMELQDADRKILEHIFKNTTKYRKF